MIDTQKCKITKANSFIPFAEYLKYEDENITQVKEYEISGFTELTVIQIWQNASLGNYHCTLETRKGDAWRNDAYFGNNFTLRKNCPFSYSYVQAPPSDAIHVYTLNATNFNFYQYDLQGNHIRTITTNNHFCNADWLYVGGRKGGNWEHPNGKILYLLVYNKALNPDEIEEVVEWLKSQL